MDAFAGKSSLAVSSSLILSLLVLAGCNKPADTPRVDGAAAVAPAQPAPYVPPTADQLAQMVAPIALFPDKLVGQVLAGATYPDQIGAANQWLAQNPTLKGDALQTAEAGQPWDVSVKSLTTFPAVLGQMASNIEWTTSLGEAYVNDPGDVMNAIQLLRARAQQSGNLKTSQQLKVTTEVRATAPPEYVQRSASEPPVYAGPPVIHAPPHIIVIDSAQPDVVYVPRYDPAVVYGAPVPVYHNWVDQSPSYSGGELVTTGALSFGIGVLVGAAVSHHHDWGWNSWGVNWGGPVARPGYDGGWHRPAVLYNNATYVSKSVTVVNHVNNVNVVNNNYRTAGTVNEVRNVSNVSNFNTVNNANHVVDVNNVNHVVNNVVTQTHNVAVNTPPPPAQRNGVMSMPHFTAHDAAPGAPARPPVAMPMHVAAPPHMNQLATLPHKGPMPATVQREQVRHEPPPANHASLPVMVQHEQRDQVRHDAQPAKAPPPAAIQLAHQDRAPEHAQEGLPHTPMHAPSPAPSAQLAGREAGRPDFAPPQAVHPNAVAMHNLAAHAAAPQARPQPPVRHVEKHEQTAHNHDKHDGPEKHG
nr:DUF3300 domain-containing protein [uncultured Duganella sp.]